MIARRSRRALRPFRGAAALLVAGAVAAAAPGNATGAQPPPSSGGTYTNPVSEGTTATFADPTTIRGKDGWWYAYASRDRVLHNVGDSAPHRIAITRSHDQVHWEYVGDVFPGDRLPDWQRPGSDSWAPDIRYLDGRYVLYYSVANPPPGVNDSFTVAAATAPTPAGPWTDSGGPVIPPKGACDTFTDIDPAQVTDTDGVRWLVWGSFRNLCTAKLRTDGLRTTGPVTEIYTGSVEAGYVVRHHGWYYLFVSENNCCIGETSSYQVLAGRSRTVDGPYVDDEGVPLTAPVGKGKVVVANSGNRWVGPGHMAVSVDRSGQDWLVYHAVPRDQPRGEPGGPGLIRPMLIDRLDWVDGWPTLRAGAWASDTPQQAPAETRLAGGGFDDGRALAADWTATGAATDGWELGHDRDSGRYATNAPRGPEPAHLLSRTAVRGDVRVSAELRQSAASTGAAGLVVEGSRSRPSVVAWLDAGQRAMTVQQREGTRWREIARSALPDDFRYDTWHTLTGELRGRALRVEVSDAGQHDPVAEATVTLAGAARPPSHVGVAARDARVDTDEVGAARLFQPVTQSVPDPARGPLDPAHSDEFDGTTTPGTTPDSPWSWVRQPVGTEGGGSFHFPTTGELFRADNTASVLTRPAPQGDYTVETKLAFDGRTAYQQAGLVAYAGDDEYLKLTTVVLADGGPVDGTQHVTAFAKDVTGSDYGESFVGTPEDSMWLRLVHRLDPDNGEHEFRGATSRDGKHWVYGAVWTLPASADPRIALASMNTPGATGQFDYVRVYRP